MTDKKILEQIDAQEERSITTGGRPTDRAMHKAIIECVEAGLGYKTAIPELIEKGYVKYGRCTITYRQYEYVRIKYSSMAVFRVQMDKSLVNWAKEHTDEIIAFIEEQIARESSAGE